MTSLAGAFGSDNPRRLYGGDFGALFGAPEGARWPLASMVFAEGADVAALSAEVVGASALSGDGDVDRAAPPLEIPGTSALTATDVEAPVATLAGSSSLSGSGLVSTLAATQEVTGASEVTGVGFPGEPSPVAASDGASSLYSTRSIKLKATLVDRLAPRISGLRATLHRKIGDLTYRVFLVRVTWSGGEPGRGSRAEVRTELGCGVDKRTGLVVPPTITYTSPTRRPGYRATARGATPASGEADVIYLTDLDPLLHERQIVDFASLGPSDESYVLIERAPESGVTRPARRYRIAGMPTYDGENLMWVLPLKAQEPSKTFGAA